MPTLKQLRKNIRDNPEIRNLFMGLAGVALAFLSITSTYAMSLPWLGDGDSPQHLDYVWQLSRGQIPNFEDAIQYQPIEERSNYSVQYVSQHPPLYYGVIGVFTSSLLESESWRTAAGVGRIISILIGLMCVGAFAYAGYLFGGKNKYFMSIALPLVAMFTATVIRVTGDIKGDILLLLLIIVSLIICYKIIYNGPSKAYISYLAVISALGMGTRASYVAVLAVSLSAVGIGYILHSKRGLLRPALKSSVVIIAIAALVLATSGWFYYLHNYQSTGNWTRSGSQSWISDVREYKTFEDVIADRRLVYSAIHTPPASGAIISARNYKLFIFFLISLSIIYFFKTKKLSFRTKDDIKPLIIAGLFIALFSITMYGQIQHAVGYGQFSERYFLSTLLPFGLLILYGIINFFKKMSVPVILGLFLLQAGALVKSHARFIERRIGEDATSGMSMFEKIIEGISRNSFPHPELIFYFALSLFCIGGIIATFSLARLSHKKYFDL